MKRIFSLENLIYLTVFSLPCYLLKITLFGLPSNALELLIIINIIFWLLSCAKKNSWFDFLEKYKTFFWPVGLIFFGLILSMLVNKSYLVSAGIIKAWFVLPVLFALAINSVINVDRRENVFKVYYFSAFFIALISLVYFIFGYLTYDGRLAGIFNSPNYLAMYLAPAIFVGYHLLWRNGAGCFKKRLVFVSSGIIILALYLTYSYATWLALLVAFLLVFGVEKKTFFRKTFVISLIMLALVFFQQGKNKFADLVSLNTRSSLASREMIWRTAEKMIQENWLYGIGVGNFQTKYLEYQKYFPPYLEWAVPHPHNLYLAFWLYCGLIGFVGFILLIIFWFKVLFAGQKNPNLKFMGLGIMVYILFHGFFDTTYFKNDLAVIFWLLFALL